MNISNILRRTLLPIIALLCASCGKPAYQVNEIGEDCQLSFKILDAWEASMPIYLEAKLKNGQRLVSGPFFYGTYEDVKNQRINFMCERNQDIIYVYTTNSPATILSMINLSAEFIYPPNHIENDAYYGQVSNTFHRLKMGLGSRDLELYR